jgi:RNA polymerase sigma-70 factor (ECF subfamily)
LSPKPDRVALDELEAHAEPLVRRAAAGDSDAFGKLYDLYVVVAHRRVAFKIRHAQDAEDVTGQVFVKALQNIQSYRADRGAFVAWLYTIADRLVIDYYRTRKETGVLDVDLLVTATDDPEGDVVRASQAAMLQQSIAKLRDDQAEILRLRFIDGFDVGEVARIVGKKEGAVRTSQYRALQTLRKIISKDAR